MVWLTIGLSNLTPVPFWAMAILIVAGEATAIAVTLMFPRHWRWRRLGIVAICLLTGLALLWMNFRNPATQMDEWIMAQLFVVTGLLYTGSSARRSFGRLAGSLGFLTWGLCYGLQTQLLGHPSALRTLYDFWNLPKYAVAFGMILTIFEESAMEAQFLTARYRMLYDDFRLLYEDHPHPMWLYDPATTRFLSANRAACRKYGFSLEEFQGMSVRQIEADRQPTDEPAPSPALLARDAVLHRHRRKDGTELSVELTDRSILFQGKEVRFVLAVDITEQERLNQELVYRAQHDALTGLPNRLMLDERMRDCLARTTREQTKAVLFTIDADHFKQINDTYGHPIGDECLKSIANRLRTRIRQIDIIARTGGEEFTAVIGGLKQSADAEKIAASLLELFQGNVHLPGLELKLTVSIGAAIFPDDGFDVETLRRKSDQALYRAKRAGRNRVVFASSALARAPEPDASGTEVGVA
jgi:diguanylate cyclase (GGDEF)-like protein/PAS domain S-box-containing protein